MCGLNSLHFLINLSKKIHCINLVQRTNDERDSAFNLLVLNIFSHHSIDMKLLYHTLVLKNHPYIVLFLYILHDLSYQFIFPFM